MSMTLSTSFAQKQATKLLSSYELHKLCFELATTSEFVMIEDDILPPLDAIPRLLKTLRSDSKIGMVSTAGCYRCPDIHKMGVSSAEQIIFSNKMITKRISCNPHLSGVHDVAAAHWGCFASRTDVHLAAFKKCEFEGFIRTYIGNDMVITNLIKQLGFRVVVDFDIWVDHMQPTEKGIYLYNKKDAIQDEYVWHAPGKIYKYRILKS